MQFMRTSVERDSASSEICVIKFLKLNETMFDDLHHLKIHNWGTNFIAISLDYDLRGAWHKISCSVLGWW